MLRIWTSEGGDKKAQAEFKTTLPSVFCEGSLATPFAAEAYAALAASLGAGTFSRPGGGLTSVATAPSLGAGSAPVADGIGTAPLGSGSAFDRLLGPCSSATSSADSPA